MTRKMINWISDDEKKKDGLVHGVDPLWRVLCHEVAWRFFDPDILSEIVSHMFKYIYICHADKRLALLLDSQNGYLRRVSQILGR